MELFFSVFWVAMAVVGALAAAYVLCIVLMLGTGFAIAYFAEWLDRRPS